MAATARILGEGERKPSIRLQDGASALAQSLPRLAGEARRIAATVHAGSHGRRRAGQGDSFWQFRRFVSGEPATRVDWRRSARDDQLYVREREWEAALAFWLWIDRSASMAFVSSLAGASKLERAALLALATAEMLVRGGERVGLAGAGPATASRRIVERLCERLVLASPDRPPDRPIGLRDEIVLFGDFIAPHDEVEAGWRRIAERGGRGHVIVVSDPIEEIFPYAGETEFLDPESGERLRVGDAAAFRKRYVDRLAAHREALRAAALRLGWTIAFHRTDQSAADCLIGLAARVSDAGATARG
jgi:uncharacterized protein (DUF58 family)